jgi:hypothetical protein
MTRITQLPPPPTRDDAANFDARADEFLPAVVTFGEEVNQVADEVNAAADRAEAAAVTAYNAPGTTATSTTSLTVGNGTKMPNVQPGKNFVDGMWVTLAVPGASNWMAGYVTDYDEEGGDLTVNVQRSNGSGTFTNWTIALSAPMSQAGDVLELDNGSTILDTAETPAKQKIGYRSLPIARTITTAVTATLTADDEAMAIRSTGGGLIVPLNSVTPLPIGAFYTFYNDSASLRTITIATGGQLRLAGTTTTGVSRTVARRGMATLWKVGTDEWLVSGNVS